MKRAWERGAALHCKRKSCLLPVGTVLVCILSMLFLPASVRADGGAPNLIYVSGALQSVGIVDVGQEKLARGFSVVGNPNMLLLSPDGGLLYVTQPTTGRVSALAAKTGQLICSVAFPGHPSLLALSIDGTVLYVAGSNERAMLALDARTCALLHSFQAPEAVSWLSVAGYNSGNTLQTQLWVAGKTAVSILDAQGQFVDRIPVAGGARYLCLPNALTAYIVTGQGRVVAADMLSHRVFSTLLTGGTFGVMDYDAVTGEIYVPDMSHQRIDVLIPVLDGAVLATREPARVIHVSSLPRAIAITNDGQFGFVVRSGGKVDMFDIPGHALIRSIDVGGEPRFVIAGPYPPLVVPAPVLPSQEVSSSPLPSLGLVAVLLAGMLFFACWLFWKQRKR